MNLSVQKEHVLYILVKFLWDGHVDTELSKICQNVDRERIRLGIV